MRFFPLTTLALAGALTAQSAAGLYDVDTLRTFHLTFASAAWYPALQQARSRGTNVKAILRVGNQVYKDVGVRFRGASSFNGTSSRKKSFNITMDAFTPGQRLMGYDSLNLSNAFNDPSFCREVISYGILRRYMPAPLANYVKLFVNNAYWGLYINVQQPDKRMIAAWYEGNGGNRYRCDAPTRAGIGKTALQWLGSTLQDYKNAYELKNDPMQAVKPWEDVRRLCDVLNNTAVGKLTTELPKVLDVDAALWYLALMSVMVNLDSYVYRGNDYYLYHDQQHDRISLLPWDMNESFAGYTPPGFNVTRLINVSPFFNEGRSSRPLLGKLFGQAEWRARYAHHVKTISDESFNWQYIGPLVTKYQALIDAAVKADTQKLYSYQKFKDNVTKQVAASSSRRPVPGLKQLANGRVAYITGTAEYKAVRASITGVAMSPSTAKPGAPVTITAKVASKVAIAEVTLYYRRIGPYQTSRMFDDGKHGDGAANDGVFGAIIPGSMHSTGQTIQYYIEATSAPAAGGAMSYHPKTAGFQAPSYVVGYKIGQSPISINEVMAKNASVIRDEKGEFEDWLELYNSSGNPVQVSGMFLTDDATTPRKWKIPPGYTIRGKSALLIWCDNEPADGPLHASFKLSGNGEEIRLVDKDGSTQLSILGYGRQADDVSNGWLLDGQPTDLVAYKRATPGVPNGLECGTRGYWPLAYDRHRMLLEWAGTPRIGARNAIRGTNVPKRSNVLLFYGLAAAVVPFSSGLHIMFGGNLAGPFGLPTSAAGLLDIPVTIPNDPKLKGLDLYLQIAGTDAQGFTVSNGVEVRVCR